MLSDLIKIIIPQLINIESSDTDLLSESLSDFLLKLPICEINRSVDLNGRKLDVDEMLLVKCIYDKINCHILNDKMNDRTFSDSIFQYNSLDVNNNCNETGNLLFEPILDSLFDGLCQDISSSLSDNDMISFTVQKELNELRFDRDDNLISDDNQQSANNHKNRKRNKSSSQFNSLMNFNCDDLSDYEP